MYRYGHPVHHPVLGIVLLVLLAALVVVGVLGLVRMWKTRPGPSGPAPTGSRHEPTGDPALTELRMRYARGEIDADEYLQRVTGLGYQVPAGPVAGGPSPHSPPPTAPG